MLTQIVSTFIFIPIVCCLGWSMLLLKRFAMALEWRGHPPATSCTRPLWCNGPWHHFCSLRPADHAHQKCPVHSSKQTRFRGTPCILHVSANSRCWGYVSSQMCSASPCSENASHCRVTQLQLPSHWLQFPQFHAPAPPNVYLTRCCLRDQWQARRGGNQ